MDAAAELGRNPVSKHQHRLSLSMEMSRLTTRNGTAEPVSRGQTRRRGKRRQGNIHFPCSADDVQNWQPYPVIHTLAISVTTKHGHTYSKGKDQPGKVVNPVRGQLNTPPVDCQFDTTPE